MRHYENNTRTERKRLAVAVEAMRLGWGEQLSLAIGRDWRFEAIPPTVETLIFQSA
jgi:hypothetical protein